MPVMPNQGPSQEYTVSPHVKIGAGMYKTAILCLEGQVGRRTLGSVMNRREGVKYNNTGGIFQNFLIIQKQIIRNLGRIVPI